MSHITRTCGLAARANDLKVLFRGVCQYDIGAEYYDERYGMTFEKFSNGISFMYRPKVTSTVGGVASSGPYPFKLFNNGQVFDTATVSEERVLCRFTIPGGTLVHNNRMSMSLSITGLGGALAGNVAITLNNNLAFSKISGFNAAATGTSKTVTLFLQAYQSNILQLFIDTNTPTAFTNTRVVNLLSDLDVQISFSFTTPNLGRSVKLNGVPSATYTVIKNTLPALPINSYRNPLETPFSDDSFWNQRIPATATYTNPATDQQVINLKDPFAGVANKVESNTNRPTNKLFIQGLVGDQVPFHYSEATDPVCDIKVGQFIGAGIRLNTPWPYNPYRYIAPRNDPNNPSIYFATAGAAFFMKMRPSAYVSGQNTDSFVVLYSGDKRFANEMGRYSYNSRKWTPNTRYEIKFGVIPSAGMGKFSYRNNSTSRFDSGTTEPVWPTVAGQTVTDNGGTWTCELYASSEPFAHYCNTLYIADLYSYGISNKFYPPLSTSQANSLLPGFDINQFHRAGGLPQQGGIVRTAELNNGFIPHVIAMQAPNAILKAAFFEVVSGVIGGFTFVVRPRPPAAVANNSPPPKSPFTQMDYSDIFSVAGVKIAHGGTFNNKGLPYTTSGTNVSYDPLTNATTFNVNEAIVSTSTTNPDAGSNVIALNWDAGEFRSATQFQWPCVTADGAAPDQYKGLTVMGAMFAIPKTVNINTLTHPNTGTPLSAEGLMVAKAFQDFGGMIVDQAGGTLGLFQIDKDISPAQQGRLSADRLTLVNALTRVSNFSRQRVTDALAEGPLPYQKPLIPFY